MEEPQSPEPQPVEPTLRELLQPVDAKIVWVMVVSAIVLTGSHYFGRFGNAYPRITAVLGWAEMDGVKQTIDEVFKQHPRRRLWQLQYWAGAHFIAYFVFPALIIKFVLREPLVDYGLKFTGWIRRLWIYVAALIIMIPLVMYFGNTEGFQRTYPYYKGAGESWFDFLSWEIPYTLQFFALEFFFRGFMIHGLKHRMGILAVPFMAIPYCMVHFGKPIPETLGAVIAGCFLGTLSLWTRSIWLGFILHVTVALGMDIAALYYKGQLGFLIGS